MTALGLFAVVALIAINGYFVAAEFAFVAARRSKFAEGAQGGDRRSIRAVAVHDRLNFMLSGAQLGITASSLVLGFIASPVIGQAIVRPVLGLFGVPEAVQFGIALTIALVLATIIQMIFGELAPKNFAIAKPEATARVLAPSTLWFMRIAKPLIAIFDGAANRLLRLLRIEPVQGLSGAVSADELDLIVDTSAESGHLSDQQATLLARAIDFGELEASDAMVPWNRVVTIEASATAADLRDLMSSAHSRFPVVDGEGSICGIVHAKDLLGVSVEDFSSTEVHGLAHEVIAVPEAAGLRTVLRDLRAHSTEMAVVVDEYGAPAGVVTLEDLVEELVGDIDDEYDLDNGDRHIEIEPGVWSVPAAWRVDEIERSTGFELPDGEYDTVAGLVLEELERIPEVGDEVIVNGVRIEVVELHDWAITRLQLSIAPPVTDEVPAVAAAESDDGTGSAAATSPIDRDVTGGDDRSRSDERQR